MIFGGNNMKKNLMTNLKHSMKEIGEMRMHLGA